MPSTDDRSREAKAALRATPFLEETGWIKSHLAQDAIDSASRPIPWYRYAAIDFLCERVDAEHRVFEFGTGNSTLWWAAHAKTVTAVEHEREWATRVRARAPRNVTVIEAALQADGEYCRTPLKTGEEYEIVVIDGRDRVNCAVQCLGALADDGVIVWDDSHRRRYRAGLALLAERGFRRLRFTGLGPIAANAGETSVLYRPSNCFRI